MVIFNSYFDITSGYQWMGTLPCLWIIPPGIQRSREEIHLTGVVFTGKSENRKPWENYHQIELEFSGENCPIIQFYEW